MMTTKSKWAKANVIFIMLLMMGGSGCSKKSSTSTYGTNDQGPVSNSPTPTTPAPSPVPTVQESESSSHLSVIAEVILKARINSPSVTLKSKQIHFSAEGLKLSFITKTDRAVSISWNKYDEIFANGISIGLMSDSIDEVVSNVKKHPVLANELTATLTEIPDPT